MRRDSWNPKSTSYICEVHFENSQFESKRADDWRKLKPNAVPTLFDVPNKPPRIDQLLRKSLYKSYQGNKIHVELIVEPVQATSAQELNPEFLSRENEKLRIQLSEVTAQVAVALREENAELRRKIEDLQNLEKNVKKCFNDDQVKYLSKGNMSEWQNETRGIRNFKLEFGIFFDILEPLRFKVESMQENDRICMISYDEMAINDQLQYDKSTNKLLGHVTLGSPDKKDVLGEKFLVVLVRGIKTKWKQAIACHVTDKNINAEDYLKFIKACMKFVEESGLYVIALSSDLDGKNRKLWTTLGVCASKYERITNSFNFNNHKVFCVPDVCHLLKNLKASLLRQDICLPVAFTEFHGLSSNVVKGSYVQNLWYHEVSKENEIRTLYHLREEDIDPSHFQKMHVGAAVRFFSVQTAAALETAVEENILPKEALTTTKFIRLIEEWFGILASKIRAASITTRNYDRKYIFLHQIIELFQNTTFGGGWKPLNCGFILATLSFCDIAENLFLKQYDFVMDHRFTQDAVENIFSQIRRKEGKMPSALQCLRALKNISVSQFISSVHRTNYITEADNCLIDFCQAKASTSSIASSMAATSSCYVDANNCEPKKLEWRSGSLEEVLKMMPGCNVKVIYHLAGSTKCLRKLPKRFA